MALPNLTLTDYLALMEAGVKLRHAIVNALAEMEKYREQDQKLSVAATELAAAYRHSEDVVVTIYPSAKVMLK